MAEWKKHIKLGIETHFKGRDYGGSGGPTNNGCIEIKPVEFPKPTGININMMPFIMSQDFNSTCLPDYLEEYHQNILADIDYDDDQWG